MRQSYQSSRQYLLSAVAVILFGAVNAVGLSQPALAQTTLVVDDDGQATASNCDAGAPAFTSIQLAVNAAAPGDTIYICPGVYDEQVVVQTSDLTIQGAGAGLTVLRPTIVNQNTVRPGTTAPVAPILLVDEATGVRVLALAIDGVAADGGANNNLVCPSVPFYVGIFYRNSSGIIDTTHVTNIMSATSCAFGILGSSGAGGAVNLAVTNSLLDNYGMVGINCLGRSTECTVTSNTIRGRGPVNDQLQSGIHIRTGATADISGNVITDHFFLPGHGAPNFSVGIFLFLADPSTNPHLLQTNVFTNNQLDVQRYGTEAVLH